MRYDIKGNNISYKIFLQPYINIIDTFSRNKSFATALILWN